MRGTRLKWTIYMLTGILLVVFFNNNIIHKSQDKVAYCEILEDAFEESETNPTRLGDNTPSFFILNYLHRADSYRFLNNLFSLTINRAVNTPCYSYHQPFYILYQSLKVYG